MLARIIIQYFCIVLHLNRICVKFNLVNALFWACFIYVLFVSCLFVRHVFSMLFFFGFLSVSFLKTNTIDVYYTMSSNNKWAPGRRLNFWVDCDQLSSSYITYRKIYKCLHKFGVFVSSRTGIRKPVYFSTSYSIYTLCIHICISTGFCRLYRCSSNAVNETERIESLVIGTNLSERANRYSLVLASAVMETNDTFAQTDFMLHIYVHMVHDEKLNVFPPPNHIAIMKIDWISYF